MPQLCRPDGAEIHWEEYGEGPGVLIANILYGHPGMIAGLAGDLSADHRVITYDLRGTGASSHGGPYDLAVDVIDLEAVLEQAGAVAVAVAFGDASMRAAHRAAIRSIVEGANLRLSEDEIRERVQQAVAHCPQEAALSRMRTWIRDDATEAARALGDRLWILHHPGNPWFPPELAERMSELLPDARGEALEDGAMSRPDLTAAVVRRITSGYRQASL
jgi:hypothetical protein